MASAPMTRATPFSYACGRCSRCCRDKGISVNPYEVLRLARNRGLATSELIARYTERAGTLLRRRDDGSCVFLGSAGCEVHPDRPLVCRIYPLARHVSAEDAETFTELEPHPQTAVRYGVEGTVGGYLETQAAGPFMQAADLYLNLFRDLADSVPEDSGTAEGAGEAEEEAVSAWLDIDRAVDRYCGERGLAKPHDVWRLMELHQQAMREWKTTLKKEK